MLATAGDEFSLAIERAGEVQHLSGGMTQAGEGEVRDGASPSVPSVHGCALLFSTSPCLYRSSVPLLLQRLVDEPSLTSLPCAVPQGIGITLVTGGAFGDRSAVVSVKKGSLGARAGLRPGDVIASVNGVSMVGRSHADVVAAIKVCAVTEI